MKKVFIIILVLLSGCTTQFSNTKKPEVIEFKLSNGIPVCYVQDEEIPMLEGTIYFPRGSLIQAFVGKKPELSALGAMIRGGGTAELSADALDALLEDLSASISVSVGSEFSTVSFESLSGDASRVMELTRQIILNHRFEDKKLELWKTRALQGIDRRVESSEEVAGIAFTQKLYSGSILENVLTSEEVKKIDFEALQKTSDLIFNSEGIRIAATGSLSYEDAKDIFEKNLGDLHYKEKEVIDYSSKIKPKPKPSIIFIQKPFTQTTIYMGEIGPRRFTDDFPEIEVMNGILGADSQFSSLLVSQVRTQKGLSYSITGGSYRDEPIGRSFIGFQTKNGSVGDAMKTVFKVLKQVQTAKFEDSLLEDVKNAVINSFVFRYENSDQFVQRRVLSKLIHYPPSYESTYIDRIGKVTKGQVVQAANRYFHPNKMVIIVVGDKAAYDSLKEAQIKKWIPSTQIKITHFDQQLHD